MTKQIVFWLPQGQLGNLIFQYQAALTLCGSNSTIIALESEFSDAFKVAPFLKLIPLTKRLRMRVTQYWVNVLRWCVKKKLFGSITSTWKTIGSYPIETTGINRIRGWFSEIWVLEGFFQHDQYANPAPELKQILVDGAEKLLSQIPQENRVAVHLRFGDYAQWSVLGKKGVCLPGSYYKKAMEQIAQTLKNPVFVVFSDDKNEAEKVIGNKYETVYFEGGASGIDIAGISLCSHAIISASTFSWWGAFLITDPIKIILAPKYWAGYKSAVWYPIDIQTKYFKYIEIAKYED